MDLGSFVCDQGHVKRVLTHRKGNGVQTRLQCQKCHAKSSYESRKKRRDAYNSQIKDKRQTDRAVRAYELWKSARDRCNTGRYKGREFSLSRSFVEKALKLGKCSVTGIEFDFSTESRKIKPFGPSIDRIDSKRGYSDDNCRVVVWIYNRAKWDGSDEDVRRLAHALLA